MWVLILYLSLIAVAMAVTAVINDTGSKPSLLDFD